MTPYSRLAHLTKHRRIYLLPPEFQNQNKAHRVKYPIVVNRSQTILAFCSQFQIEVSQNVSILLTSLQMQVSQRKSVQILLQQVLRQKRLNED